MGKKEYERVYKEYMSMDTQE